MFGLFPVAGRGVQAHQLVVRLSEFRQQRDALLQVRQSACVIAAFEKQAPGKGMRVGVARRLRERACDFADGPITMLRTECAKTAGVGG